MESYNSNQKIALWLIKPKKWIALRDILPAQWDPENHLCSGTFPQWLENAHIQNLLSFFLSGINKHR